MRAASGNGTPALSAVRWVVVVGQDGCKMEGGCVVGREGRSRRGDVDAGFESVLGLEWLGEVESVVGVVVVVLVVVVLFVIVLHRASSGICKTTLVPALRLIPTSSKSTVSGRGGRGGGGPAGLVNGSILGNTGAGSAASWEMGREIESLLVEPDFEQRGNSGGRRVGRRNLGPGVVGVVESCGSGGVGGGGE